MHNSAARYVLNRFFCITSSVNYSKKTTVLFLRAKKIRILKIFRGISNKFLFVAPKTQNTRVF